MITCHLSSSLLFLIFLNFNISDFLNTHFSKEFRTGEGSMGRDPESKAVIDKSDLENIYISCFQAYKGFKKRPAFKIGSGLVCKDI